MTNSFLTKVRPFLTAFILLLTSMSGAVHAQQHKEGTLVLGPMAISSSSPNARVALFAESVIFTLAEVSRPETLPTDLPYGLIFVTADNLIVGNRINTDALPFSDQPTLDLLGQLETNGEECVIYAHDAQPEKRIVFVAHNNVVGQDVRSRKCFLLGLVMAMGYQDEFGRDWLIDASPAKVIARILERISP